jgi:hypothetical protein
MPGTKGRIRTGAAGSVSSSVVSSAATLKRSQARKKKTNSVNSKGKEGSFDVTYSDGVWKNNNGSRDGKRRVRKSAAQERAEVEALLEEDNEDLPSFERSFGVGKVLRPHLVSEGAGGGGGGGGGWEGEEQGLAHGMYVAPHDTHSLQKLWGEEEGEAGGGGLASQHPLSDGGVGGGDGGDHSHGHGERVQQMRERTGMVFAANPREFDLFSGLAKFGRELSDDEGESVDAGMGIGEGESGHGAGIRVVTAVGAWDAKSVSVGRGANIPISGLSAYNSTAKPTLDTVAYDSELDGSD